MIWAWMAVDGSSWCIMRFCAAWAKTELPGGMAALHARYERLQPGHAPQHVLLEVHHQQRGALRIEDGCLVAHAFSYALPCLPAPAYWPSCLCFMIGWTGSLCCP